MIWAIEYERIDNTRVHTTFISKETETDLVIGRFEKMHGHRLTVIECKPRRKAETPEQKEARLTAFEKDLLPVRKAKQQWQLIRVDDIEWTQDDSGIYVLINWDTQTDSVRIDVMPTTSVPSDVLPIVSFAGRADNVRKATMQWFESRVSQKTLSYRVSLEHAAYIGAELERCDTERIDYVQD